VDNYAIIETGGRQYIVKPNQLLKIEKIDGDIDSEVNFNVLLIDGKEANENATVKGRIKSQFRDKKIIVFKKIRRKGYKRKQGHRQSLTEVMISTIDKGE